MEKVIESDKILLPHHVQRELCETRLPYRQGRKLTAVKVYSITTESNHLLIFGVPSLNLRREIKTLFMRFGKLIQFNVSNDHAAEPFTETYHAQYVRIHAARLAKRTLDTKNFYGGILHICYAPELENLDETKQKLVQRQNDVLLRLKTLENEEEVVEKTDSQNVHKYVEVAPNCEMGENKMLNMGEINVIRTGNEVRHNKRKAYNNTVVEKKFKPCFVDQSNEITLGNDTASGDDKKLVSSNVKQSLTDVPEVEIVDCTLVDKTTISNINEALNYNKFGDEVILKLPRQPVNKIMFNVNKKSLIY